MSRISGIELPNEKRIDIALTILYGVGRNNVKPILKQAGIEASTKTKDLSAEQINKLQKVVDQFPFEGALRKTITDNIERLKQIGAYRGIRHTRGLPSRGQRTRSNARTKRGRRKTIGAIKKEETARTTSGVAGKQGGASK